MNNTIRLKRAIDPRIDYVFKVLFATAGNESIIVSFLNTIIKPPIPIESVAIINPFNEREFENDKLSIVDVKVTDEKGFMYQIEMQLGNHKDIKVRSAVNWAQIYSKQVAKGEAYEDVKPTICIWLLTQNITKKSNFHNVVEMRYRNDLDLYLEHMEIHLLELNKWAAPDTFSDEDLWAFMLSRSHIKFELPQLFTNPIMRRVMSQIREISDKETKWARYHSRMMWERDQEAMRQEQERIKQESEAMKQESEAVKQESAAIKQETEAMKQALEQSEKEKAELLEKIAQLEGKQ